MLALSSSICLIYKNNFINYLYRRVQNQQKSCFISDLVTLPKDCNIPKESFYYFKDIVSEDQEDILFKYFNELFKNRKYQGVHWDNVISRYREIELVPDLIIDRDVYNIMVQVKRSINKVFGKEIDFLPIHVIDLAPKGLIG